MSNRIWVFPILLLIIFSLLFPYPAEAQIASRAVLSSLNVAAFPTNEAFLDVHDATGGFVNDLQPAQIQLMEDGNQVEIEALEELRPGVQFVVVFNPGPSFGIRDSKGISRYDYLKGAVGEWAKGRQGTNLDDLSLLITDGPSISHTADPLKFVSILQSDKVNPRAANPSLDTLLSAANVASDPTPRPGMGRAILFITPPLEGADISLDSLIAQAQQAGVVIFVWMVATQGAYSTQGVQRLNDLASQTGGSVFTYSGEETLPNPEEYISVQRDIYRLTYHSASNTSGSHDVYARLILDSGVVETNKLSYDINILPPVPAFVSPPLQIQRKLPAESGDQAPEDVPLNSYIPQQQSLQIIFDFPDGRKRDLVKTAFFVDGALVSENTSPPFDQFVWTIEGYTSEGTHLLKVQATDAFGLTGESIEIPVAISFLRPKASPWSTIQGNLPILAGLAVLLSGAILLLVLIIGGQLRPTALSAARRKSRKSDPLSQPVPVRKENPPRHFPGWVSRLHWPQHNAAAKAFAFLRRIDESGELPADPPIAIVSDETSIGRDPNLAVLVLNDPSVEGLHACLNRQADGSFRLADAGSIAGTWINYSPINQEGARLEHGDLVHIGRICFRFSIQKPQTVRKPVIITEAADAERIEEPTL
jgi:hypothetical protein